MDHTSPATDARDGGPFPEDRMARRVGDQTTRFAIPRGICVVHRYNTRPWTDKSRFAAPETPGVYILFEDAGKPVERREFVHVGKATNLRDRFKRHKRWQDDFDDHRTKFFMAFQTRTVREAEMLERLWREWCKRHGKNY